MADLIQKTDTLNQGREKLNTAITDAETAKIVSEQADDKATQALAKSGSTQTQLDTIVIDGDSSVEAAQARVSVEGTAYGTLKQRLDTEYEEVTTQLAQTLEELETINTNKADKEEVNTKAEKKYVDDQIENLNTSKADETYVDSTNVRIDNLIVESGNANAEVDDSHVSTVKNKKYKTLNNRLNESEKDVLYISKQLGTVLRNAIVNGDFKDNSEWTPSNATITTSNGKLIIKSDGSAINPRVSQNTLTPARKGHKIYARAVFNVKSEVEEITFNLYNSNFAGNYRVISNRISPELNGEYVLHNIIETPSEWTGDYRVTLQYQMQSLEANKEIEIAYVSLIDLTEAFGIGNEPDLASFNDFVSSLPSKWIDNIEIISNSKVENTYQVDSEGKAGIKSQQNPNWTGWDNPFYGYGYSKNSARIPIELEGMTEFKGTMINKAPANQRRWGFHLFEGYSTNGTDRLTMLIDKHEGYVEIYHYFQPPDGDPTGEKYKWVRIGSDVQDRGWDFTHAWAKSHTPLSWSPRTTDPTAMPDGSEVPDGTIYFNSSLNRLRLKIGGIWKSIALE